MNFAQTKESQFLGVYANLGIQTAQKVTAHLFSHGL